MDDLMQSYSPSSWPATSSTRSLTLNLQRMIDHSHDASFNIGPNMIRDDSIEDGTVNHLGAAANTTDSSRLISEIPSTVGNGIFECNQQQNTAQMPISVMWHEPTDNHNDNVGSAMASAQAVHNNFNGKPDANIIAAAEACHMCFGTATDQGVFINPICGPQTVQEVIIKSLATRSSSQQMCFGTAADQGVLINPICGRQTLEEALIRPLTTCRSSQQVHISHDAPRSRTPILRGTMVKPTRARARRGQATDPHSIAERLRRERIAERMKALQELVPIVNKIDKAYMLDDVIKYVKFLQLQVKLLSMSRMRSASLLGPHHVADGLMLAGGILDKGNESGNCGILEPSHSQEALGVTERQVAKLMEENMASAMQFLQSKGLCLMPISLVTTTLTESTPKKVQSGSLPAAYGSSLPSVAPMKASPASNASSTPTMVVRSIDVADKACIPILHGTHSSYRQSVIIPTNDGEPTARIDNR